MTNLGWNYLYLALWRCLIQVASLSYIEKSVVDRLLTYYDDKVRPTDERNFFVTLDSDEDSLQPLIVNVSVNLGKMWMHDKMLTIDVELYETWFDDRLRIPQNTEKFRHHVQLPSDARIWLPNGGPSANFYEPASTSPQRKITLMESARMEVVSRFLIRTQCDQFKSDLHLPFMEYFECSVHFEPEDTHDVHYFCNSCQQHSTQAAPPEHFTYHADVRTVLSKGEGDRDGQKRDRVDRRRGLSRNQRKLNRKRMKGKRKNRESVVFNGEDIEELEFKGEKKETSSAIGDQLQITISLTRESTNYYLITAVAPAALLVFLVWITLFSQRKMIRATFQATAFFALIVLWGNHKQAPSATKLDGWLLICLIFITLGVVECVLLASIQFPRPRLPIEKRQGSMGSVNRIVVVNNSDGKEHPNGGLMVQVEQCGLRVKRFIDKERVHVCFALAFPIVFVAVSLWYWLKAGI